MGKFENETTIYVSKGYIRKLSATVIYVRMKDNSHFREEDSLEFINAVLKLANGQAHLFLVNTGKHSNSDFRAREVVAKHPELQKIRLAEAFVVNSVFHRFLVSFYFTFHRPANPTKVFDNEDLALSWLQTIHRG